MAIGSSSTSWENGQAWVQINFDTVALEVVSVVYQNNTGKTATVEITQPPNRNDTFTILPGAGVPTPITQAVPHNRYTYTLNAKNDLAPDFTYSATFK